MAVGYDPGPLSVATDAAGNLYVADTANNRVQKFSAAGDPIAVLGSRGRRPGQFIDPMSVAVDPAGNLYVADHAASYLEAGGAARVQKFAADGSFVAHWWSAPALPARPKLSASVGRRTVRRTATFRFRSWQEDVRFKCRLLGRRAPRKLRRWRPRSSPKRYRRLPPGRKVFSVKATSGGEDSEQAGRAWRIVKRGVAARHRHLYN